MEVSRVLHMSGGDGQSSYAHNSLLQKKGLTMAKLVREEAVRKVYESFGRARCLSIADMGCSSGPNTLFFAEEFITITRNLRIQGGKSSNQLPVDYEVFLNDLPGTDFNTIFKSLLPIFQRQLNTGSGTGGDDYGHCFIHGVPGSFYERLFKDQSLHFVHSASSLHFLSQVPKGIGRSNKGNINLSSRSPASVVKAYYQQFQSDFTNFLRHRSEELVAGGGMFLTLLCTTNNDPRNKDIILHLLGMALNQMVCEGLMEEEKLDTFNVPIYAPSPSDIKAAVEEEGSFAVDCLQVSEVEWAASVSHANGDSGKDSAADGIVKCMRAVTESMLTDHFGEEIIDEVFRRFRNIVADRMDEERTAMSMAIVSLTKTI